MNRGSNPPGRTIQEMIYLILNREEYFNNIYEELLKSDYDLNDLSKENLLLIRKEMMNNVSIMDIKRVIEKRILVSK